MNINIITIILLIFSSNLTLDSMHSKVYINHQKSEFGNIVFPFADKESILSLENIDDRTDDAEFLKLGKHIFKRLVLNLKIFKALKIYKGLIEEYYNAEREGKLIQKINSQEYLEIMTKNVDQFNKRWLKSKKASKALSLWGTRNKRMAERIVRSIESKSPQRVIVFFGAAHIEFVARELRKVTQLEVMLYSDFKKTK